MTEGDGNHREFGNMSGKAQDFMQGSYASQLQRTIVPLEKSTGISYLQVFSSGGSTPGIAADTLSDTKWKEHPPNSAIHPTNNGNNANVKSFADIFRVHNASSLLGLSPTMHAVFVAAPLRHRRDSLLAYGRPAGPAGNGRSRRTRSTPLGHRAGSASLRFRQ